MNHRGEPPIKVKYADLDLAHLTFDFYVSWKAHKDAGFDPSRDECEKLAKLYGIDAPPFGTSEKEDIVKVVEMLAPTPAGQEILRKIAEFIPEYGEVPEYGEKSKP